MSLKRFKIDQVWNDLSITVEADFNTLTPDKAALINNFWTGANERLCEFQNEELSLAAVQLAVIRMFAKEAMFLALTEHEGLNEQGGHWCTRLGRDVRDREGWGGEAEGNEFGWCGIRVVRIDCDLPDLDDLTMEEVG